MELFAAIEAAGSLLCAFARLPFGQIKVIELFTATKFLFLPVRLINICAKNQEEKDKLYSQMYSSTSRLKSIYFLSALVSPVVVIAASPLFQWISPSREAMLYRAIGGAQALMGTAIVTFYCTQMPSEKRVEKGVGALVVVLTAIEAYFGSRLDYLSGRQALYIGTGLYSIHLFRKTWNQPTRQT